MNEKRRYKNIPFDINPVPSSSLSSLSRVAFESEYLPSAFAPDVLEGNGRSYEERLASCRMILSPEETTPTVLGLLTVGVSPQDFLPGASIQFLRIGGTELEDPVLDERVLSGTLVEILRAADDKFKAHNNVALDIIRAPRHVISPLYPPVAFQQLIYNAVLHRTYENTNAPVRVYWFDDRIEIHSPGGPYGNVTESNFGRPGITDYRNPNLAAVMKNLGFVQTFGRGIATARRELGKNGNPALEFEVTSSSVVAIMRGKR